eukprot:CAMPEP_0117677374 /NCGR_PEP_ID=MMETSP0804-20121206/16711_1 /TAXON_ID=1074897 /ORGANISM="Tetraselmis astigmatica, Strain CCMP880" /LENGTH=174 /DNA_ID=CAMNT_0005486653 /DNA_START=108 /DNA_END=632 /DNA_ORIENTATION=-
MAFDVGVLPHWASLVCAAGVGAALGYYAATVRLRGKRELWREDLEDDGESDWEDEEDVKLVLVVRQDLKMGKGKIAAQCCHAAVGAVQQEQCTVEGLKALRRWEDCGETKVAVKAETEATLLDVEQRCHATGVPCFMIIDAGRTQIAPNTRTVLAVGPAASSAVDAITGELKLL